MARRAGTDFQPGPRIHSHPALIIDDLFSLLSCQETAETSAVLECVMDSLTDEALPVQSVAADCFLEFFVWFDKSKDSTSAKGLLKSIAAYARHPDDGKRFAAAFAFNKIYNIFRENKDLGRGFEGLCPLAFG